MNEFELWLEFEIWIGAPPDDPTDDFFNMVITFPDGREYALNVWTFKYIERGRFRNNPQSPNIAGKYLIPPDLLVEKLDRRLIHRVVTDLIDTGQLNEQWLVERDEDDDEDE